MRVVVTINTRFKAGEAAHVLRTSEARLVLTVTDFLDTDYAAALHERADIPSVAGDRRAERTRPARLDLVGRLRWPAATRSIRP